MKNTNLLIKAHQPCLTFKLETVRIARAIWHNDKSRSID